MTGLDPGFRRGDDFLRVHQKLTYEAAKLKGRYKIAYADCFAAALSHRLNAVVVTGDPEFRKLGDEYSIQWIKANNK